MTALMASDAATRPDVSFGIVVRADGSIERRRAEREHADRLISTSPSLDETGRGNGFSLRWNLLNVIGEYARHNGHADLLRQAIDCAVGE